MTAPEPTLRELAVERSLRAARAKAESRGDRFIETATMLLGETGRTDFTVQELVERSQTSLRSFYQHFQGKDELMQTLFESVMTTSAERWRERASAYDDEVQQLRSVVVSLHSRAHSVAHAGLNNALTSYQLTLAETRPTEYARMLAPLSDLFTELIQRGVDSGRFRRDVSAEALAVILMQTITSPVRQAALETELATPAVTGEQIWAFCFGALSATAASATAASPES